MMHKKNKLEIREWVDDSRMQKYRVTHERKTKSKERRTWISSFNILH